MSSIIPKTIGNKFKKKKQKIKVNGCLKSINLRKIFRNILLKKNLFFNSYLYSYKSSINFFSHILFTKYTPCPIEIFTVYVSNTLIKIYIYIYI